MTQALEIVTVENVRGYVDENNVAWINLEDAARGLGFVQTQNKGGKEYTSVRWERVNQYLKEFGFPPQVGERFIPENIFYRLAMKASNAAAQAFQAKIADVILPSIRKHGVYATNDFLSKSIADPMWAIGILTALKETQDKAAALEAKNTELQPKADFYDRFLNSNETMPITYIAKTYGKGGAWLNSLFEGLKIQRKVGGRWVLNYKYTDEGYTRAVTKQLADGRLVTHTEWTNRGRILIYNRLKEIGIVPEREREENQLQLFEEASS